MATESKDPHPAHQELRGALEFAVEVARVAQRQRPSIPIPADLKRFTKMGRVPTGQLGRLRRTVESNEPFRRALAEIATTELVGEIGRLWLQRPDGWLEQIDEQLAERAAEQAEEATQAELRREQRRREAAEHAVIRARTELVAARRLAEELDAEREEQRRINEALETERDELQATVAELRVALRHADDRAEGARLRFERVHAEAEALRAALGSEPSEVTTEPTGEMDPALTAISGIDPAQVESMARRVRELADELAALGSPPTRDTGARSSSRSRRRPLRMPGGVRADSDAGAEHLLHSDALVIVDGYNVSMRGWPELSLEQQRAALIDVSEALVVRFGTEVLIVFDGAEVPGAASGRRLDLRVRFSPADVIADDVIREEVAQVPADRAVVVVTDDRALRADVAAQGANTLASARYLAVAMR